MRNVQWLRAVALSILFASGCATGPSIRIDKDPGVDRRAYKTFGFFDQVQIFANFPNAPVN